MFRGYWKINKNETRKCRLILSPIETEPGGLAVCPSRPMLCPRIVIGPCTFQHLRSLQHRHAPRGPHLIPPKLQRNKTGGSPAHIQSDPKHCVSSISSRFGCGHVAQRCRCRQTICCGCPLHLKSNAGSGFSYADPSACLGHGSGRGSPPTAKAGGLPRRHQVRKNGLYQRLGILLGALAKLGLPKLGSHACGHGCGGH